VIRYIQDPRVTFKDLQKLVESQSQPDQTSPLFDRLRNKPFWIWDQQQHRQEDIRTKGDCCFNHIIGLPQKDGHDMPLLSYQKTLYDSLQRNKHIWIKKSRGIGVTEFLLRYIAWLCISRINPANDRVCIITGPRIDLAEDLIARFKGLFDPIFSRARTDKKISFDRTASTVAFLNGVKVEAFPSRHVDTMRGLDAVRFILSDETDFYPAFQQREVRAVMEGYIGKPNSDPHIVLVSTPKAPGGLMQQIELESDSLYHKLFFDYHHGLQGPYPIYSQTQIDQAKLSPEFPREYELQYLGVVGNVFSQTSIESCQKIEYNPGIIVPESPKSIGIDPSYGSSNFAIVATQLVDNKIQVIHAEEYARPNFTEMIEMIWQLKNRMGHVSNIYVDAANPEVIRSLKQEFGESYNEQYMRDQFADCKKYNLHIEDRMFICPTPFSVEGAKMLQHTKWLLEEKDEDGSSLIAIHPSFEKLLTALRTAVASEYKLDKQETTYNDILDGFRLALQYYKRSK
jgi:hypothetical protein